MLDFLSFLDKRSVSGGPKSAADMRKTRRDLFKGKISLLNIGIDILSFFFLFNFHICEYLGQITHTSDLLYDI